MTKFSSFQMLPITFLVFASLNRSIHSDCSFHLCAQFASNKPPYLVGLDTQKRIHLYDDQFCGYTVPFEKLDVSSRVLDLKDAQVQSISPQMIKDRTHFGSSNVANLWMTVHTMTRRLTTYAILKQPNEQDMTVFQYYGSSEMKMSKRNTDHPDVLFSTLHTDSVYGVSTSAGNEGCLIASKGDNRNYFRRIPNKINSSSECIFRGEQVYRGFTADNETSFVWSREHDGNSTKLMVTTFELVPPSHRQRNRRIIQKTHFKLKVLSRKHVSAFLKCTRPSMPLLWMVYMVISLIMMVIICALGYMTFMRSDWLHKSRYKTLKSAHTASNAKLGSFSRRQSGDVKWKVTNNDTSSNKSISPAQSINSISSVATGSISGKSKASISTSKTFDVDSVNSQNTSSIPPLVESIVNYLSSDDGDRLSVENIFRSPGSLVIIKELKKKAEKGETINWADFEKERGLNSAVFCSTSLLKTFLRELKDPVLSYNAIAGLQVKSESPQAVATAKDVLRKVLPKTNFELLKYLFTFFEKVLSHTEVNKMDISALATCVGPSLIRASADQPQLKLKEVLFANEVFIFLQRYHTVIFS